MKKLFKILGIISISVIITFSMMACEDDELNGNGNGFNNGNTTASACPGCGSINLWTWGGNNNVHWANNCSCDWFAPHNFVNGVCVCGATSGSSGGVTVPSAPTGVSVTAQSSSSISVSWNSVSGATSYDVYFEIGSSTVKNLAGNVTGTSFTHTGLTASTTYYYYIKAKNSAGESGFSSFSFATTQSSGGGVSIPSTPTGVSATALSSTSIRITWNAVSGATSYRIYSPNFPGSTTGFSQIGTSTSTSYTDTYPLAGETWYYRVTAVNSAGESPQSVSVFATTSGGGGGVTIPSAPTGVTAVRNPRSSEYVTISWNTVSGATGYRLYYSTTSASGPFTFAGTATTSPREYFFHNNLTSYWKVSATNSAGESAQSTTTGTALGWQQ